MTIFDAENGTDGTSLTTANSGWSSITVGTSASMLFSSAGRFNGNLGYRATTSSTAAGCNLRWSGDTNANVGFYRLRFYFRYSARPASGVEGRIVRIMRNSQTQGLVQLYLLANGGLSLRTNGTNTSTETTRFNSSVALAVNTWYRIEIVVGTNNATTNSLLGLGVTVGQAALTTTNSGNNIYYYSSAMDLGVGLGIGPQDFLRTETGTAQKSWAVTIDADAFQMDTTGFNSSPSTWIGPNILTLSSTLAMSSVPEFYNFFSYVQRFGGLSMAANDDFVINPAAITRPGALPMTAAFDDLAITPAVTKLATVPAAALSALAVTPAAGTISAALAMGVSPTVAIAGQKIMAAILSASVSSSMALGAIRAQLAALGVQAAGQLALEVTGLFQDTWLSGAAGSFVIPNTDVSHRYVMPFDAMGGIVMEGFQRLPYLWPARATPAFQVSGRGAQTVALSMRGTPALALAGTKMTIGLVPLTAAGRLAIAGVSIGDLINYDFVKALILRRDVAAVLFIRDSAARLRDTGRRRAKLRPASVAARPLAAGMLARIKE